MKSRRDLVDAWFKKAESDLAVAELCIKHATALDIACFHAQQAAEKSLKAYLTHIRSQVPFVHNLEKLVTLCARHEAGFNELVDIASGLTPFAVQLRYDAEFWPTLETAVRARESARCIVEFCREKIAF